MRVSLALTRLLAFTNGLEAFTAIAAILWAGGYWFAQVTIGSPVTVAGLAAPLLAVLGTVSLLALVHGWRRTRTAASLLAFQVWAMLTALTWTESLPSASAVGLYGAMAVAELALYVRTKLQLDVRTAQLANVIHAQLSAGAMSAVNVGRTTSGKGESDV